MESWVRRAHWSAASLVRDAPAPLVVVCHSEDAADMLADDLQLFAPGLPLRFPAWESTTDEWSVHDAIYGDRLRTLKRLHTWYDHTALHQPAADRAPGTRGGDQYAEPDATGTGIGTSSTNSTRHLAVGDQLDSSN